MFKVIGIIYSSIGNGDGLEGNGIHNIYMHKVIAIIYSAQKKTNTGELKPQKLFGGETLSMIHIYIEHDISLWVDAIKMKTNTVIITRSMMRDFVLALSFI